MWRSSRGRHLPDALAWLREVLGELLQAVLLEGDDGSRAAVRRCFCCCLIAWQACRQRTATLIPSLTSPHCLLHQLRSSQYRRVMMHLYISSATLRMTVWEHCYIDLKAAGTCPWPAPSLSWHDKL